MTRERAAEIYRSDYWLPAGCARFPAPIAIAVFDAAVNQGVGAAVRTLQAALELPQDGIVGPKTVALAQRMDARKLLADYLARPRP